MSDAQPMTAENIVYDLDDQWIESSGYSPGYHCGGRKAG